MIAIHHRKGSFSDKWVEFCEINDISFKLVDCYANDIIDSLGECHALLWHWHHNILQDSILAKSLIRSAKELGVHVFPDIDTCWHFDDKVAQKYLLESINAPLAKSYVFYREEDALKWARETNYPKVFKLRGGASSENVKMIESKEKAIKYIKKAFGIGFLRHSVTRKLSESLWRFKRQKNLHTFLNIGKGVGRIFIPTKKQKDLPRERGYIYSQDFIGDNPFDIRVIVIGERAFAIKRMNRKGDFRASGSGYIKYEKKEIPVKCIEIAFSVSRKVKAQSLAFDFVFLKNEPKILEISYAFLASAYRKCPGYWDSSLVWHEGAFHPEYFIISDVISKIENSN